MAEKRLAMITARGGSKRIPRKNIKDFCGKPILFYSIEAALKAGVFDEVMVSTDDEEIADLVPNVARVIRVVYVTQNAVGTVGLKEFDIRDFMPEYHALSLLPPRA